MTTHRPHPITGDWLGRDYRDPDDAVLYDDCERCAQHARHPFDSLDDEHLRPLVVSAYTALGTGRIPDQPTEAMLDAVLTIREEIRRAEATIRRANGILSTSGPDVRRPTPTVPDGPPPPSVPIL